MLHRNIIPIKKLLYLILRYPNLKIILDKELMKSIHHHSLNCKMGLLESHY